MKILLFAVGIIAIFLAIVIRGYVFMFFWNSFVVPAFGVNEFGFVICAGLSSFVFISGFTLVVGLILKAML